MYVKKAQKAPWSISIIAKRDEKKEMGREQSRAEEKKKENNMW
jgi:hypothetical protein